MTSDAIGRRVISASSIRLLQGLGFSNGCVELGPKYPPPLVPICLTATSAATGPRAMVWVSILAAAPSIGVALTAPSKVIGIPLATRKSARITQSGMKTKHKIRIKST